MGERTIKCELLGGPLDGHIVEHPVTGPLPKEFAFRAMGAFKKPSIYVLGPCKDSDYFFYRFEQR
jgi:hypothetical protein